GAGLDDYWTATLASRVGAGGFIWAFVDEAVQRAPGQFDTAGNAAPDGILGPHREKEGSYYTVRQIWSPVQIGMTALPNGFDGTLPVQNRYDSTDLASVDFSWQLVRFDFQNPLAGNTAAGNSTSGHTVQAEGSARTGSIQPGASGSLALGLPADRAGAQALLLDAKDATGRLIGKWSWMLEAPAAIRASIVPAASSGSALATDDGATLTVSASGTTYTFARANGTLTGVTAGGRSFALKNGPTLSVGSATLTALSGVAEGNDYVITASYSGNLEQLVWRVRGDGWLSLDYRYGLQGAFDFLGIDFDCAEAEVSGAQWLGRGPSRVWKNRLRGPWHDVWQRAKNDAITGQRWDFPEFKGYFDDVYWARLATNAGSIEIVMDSPGLFLRLFTPTNGPNPQLAAAAFPAHDLSILHAIPPIGDKFLAAAEHGPQSAPNPIDGTLSARLYFHFVPSAP
ncbi:MAG: glycoside hydrolase family 2, partial [Deltaproteobacteria bacterium]